MLEKPTMLTELKAAMRIVHDKLDSDLQLNIDACKLDLQRVGINTDSLNDLLKKAIELYAKWQYDYNGKGEQYRKNYESLRDALSMSGDYNGGDKNV